MDFSFLNQLTETPGVSGREERVREMMEKQFAALSAEINVNAMGSIIAHLPGKGPRVALMAHMDEVGFLVSKIDPKGFVRVMPVGGVDARVFGAQKVVIHGRRDLPGIVGSIPPHLLKKESGSESKAIPIEESFIDLGLPAEEISALVRVGDPVTFAAAGWQNDHSFFAKAIDDRVGLFIMLEAMRKAAKIDCDLFLIASTQEEYGLRGAAPSIFAVMPHVALAIEGTVASDTPGLSLPSNILATCVDRGPEIRLTDRGMISSRPLADFLINLAEFNNIPHQVIVKNTGATDATASQTVGSGVRVGAVSVPVRYIHAPIGMARKADVIRTVDLVVAFLESASKLDILK